MSVSVSVSVWGCDYYTVVQCSPACIPVKPGLQYNATGPNVVRGNHETMVLFL